LVELMEQAGISIKDLPDDIEWLNPVVFHKKNLGNDGLLAIA
jgi:hypothetical protein